MIPMVNPFPTPSSQLQSPGWTSSRPWVAPSAARPSVIRVLWSSGLSLLSPVPHGLCISVWFITSHVSHPHFLCWITINQISAQNRCPSMPGSYTAFTFPVSFTFHIPFHSTHPYTDLRPLILGTQLIFVYSQRWEGNFSEKSTCLKTASVSRSNSLPFLPWEGILRLFSQLKEASCLL